jgi:hypothetical protein
VKEYHETVEYIHWNPVRRGLVARPDEWRRSSVHEYAFGNMAGPRHEPALRIDRVGTLKSRFWFLQAFLAG